MLSILSCPYFSLAGLTDKKFLNFNGLRAKAGKMGKPGEWKVANELKTTFYAFGTLPKR